MLRHAEMPKGSRRAPNVYRRVHSRPRHTAQWVGLFFRNHHVGTAAIGCPVERSSTALAPNLPRIPARLVLVEFHFSLHLI
jgi:hypothetical protein